MSEDFIPLPSNVVRSSQSGHRADDPKLDELIGETVCIRAVEWIGAQKPYMGVRLYVHVVKGETMTKSPRAYRAYTEAVMRVARDLAGGDDERTTKLEQWPIYRVGGTAGKYSLTDA